MRGTFDVYDLHCCKTWMSAPWRLYLLLLLPPKGYQLHMLLPWSCLDPPLNREAQWRVHAAILCFSGMQILKTTSLAFQWTTRICIMLGLGISSKKTEWRRRADRKYTKNGSFGWTYESKRHRAAGACFCSIGMCSLLEWVSSTTLFCVFRRATISPGEQQRLALARLCYQHPRLAVLDEATSQLSEPDEQQAYESLLRRGINLVSIGHRASLRAYHTKELELLGGGAWRFGDITRQE